MLSGLLHNLDIARRFDVCVLEMREVPPASPCIQNSTIINHPTTQWQDEDDITILIVRKEKQLKKEIGALTLLALALSTHNKQLFNPVANKHTNKHTHKHTYLPDPDGALKDVVRIKIRHYRNVYE